MPLCEMLRETIPAGAAFSRAAGACRRTDAEVPMRLPDPAHFRTV